jgi:hypothetical protein
MNESKGWPMNEEKGWKWGVVSLLLIICWTIFLVLIQRI